jgi:copper(I)-binding protein
MTTTTPHHPAVRRRRGRALAFVGIAALVGVAASCGDDDDEGSSDGIEITDAWARTSPMVAEAGAVYMQISNTGDTDDALVGVSVDESVAGRSELHETVAADGAMGSETTMAGDMTAGTAGSEMMTMQPVDEILVPAGGSVSLEPGGYHVMLLELAEPLEAGDTIEVTLTFETAGEQVVTADVRDDAP